MNWNFAELLIVIGFFVLQEILGKGKAAPKSSADKEAHDEPAYEEVKKDLNALSKEEQMDVVYR